MWLLKASTVVSVDEGASIELVEFDNHKLASYAILSHTWAEDEVLFRHIRDNTARSHKGFHKLKYAAEQTLKDGLEHLWVDTCCIDKSSSAELQEAINSMYKWYEDSAVCYAYLTDVPLSETEQSLFKSIRDSRWFTRGWTVQELLAPSVINFYGKDWTVLGLVDKRKIWHTCVDLLGNSVYNMPMVVRAVIAGSRIDMEYLLNPRAGYKMLSYALRMSWFSSRQTSRKEDIAYCMLGILDITMPLLYGEGGRAFLRLQEEIMRRSDDYSLFTWMLPCGTDSTSNETTDDAGTASSFHEGGLLALHPAYFLNCEIPRGTQKHRHDAWPDQAPYLMTNKGLQIELPLIHIHDDVYLATFDQIFRDRCHCGPYGVYLRKLYANKNIFARVFHDRLGVGKSEDPGEFQTIYITNNTYALDSERRVRIHLDTSSHITQQYQLNRLFSKFVAMQSEALYDIPLDRRWGVLAQIQFIDLKNSSANCIAIYHVASEENILIYLGTGSDGGWGVEARIAKMGEKVESLGKLSEEMLNISASKTIILAADNDPDVPRHRLHVTVDMSSAELIFTIGIQYLLSGPKEEAEAQERASERRTMRNPLLSHHLCVSHSMRQGQFISGSILSIDEPWENKESEGN